MSDSHLCITRNENEQPRYFQNRIIMFCLPVPTLMYLWEIYAVYSQDRSTYFAAAKYSNVDRSWEYINCLQTCECRDWDWGHAIPFPGILKFDFRYGVHATHVSLHVNCSRSLESSAYPYLTLLSARRQAPASSRVALASRSSCFSVFSCTHTGVEALVR